MFISSQEAREAEASAKQQAVGMARQYLRADETKAETAADKLRIRRMMQAAQDLSPSFNEMLAEPDASRLFACGALYLVRPET